MISHKLHLNQLRTIFKSEALKTSLTREEFKIIIKISSKNQDIIRFNNIKKMNCIDMDTAKELFTLFSYYDTQPLKLKIFTGDDNNKIFSSGANLKFLYTKYLNNEIDELYEYFNLNYYLFDKFHQNKFDNSSIFIWNGQTMGGGLALGIDSNFRICTESSVLGMHEALFGFYTNCNYSDFIPRFLDIKSALNMSLFAHKYYGYESYLKGFATHFVANRLIPDLITDLYSINLQSSKEYKEVEKCLDYYHEKSILENILEIEKVKYELEQKENYISKLFQNVWDLKDFYLFYEQFCCDLQNKFLEEELTVINPNINFKKFYTDFISNSLLTLKLNFDIVMNGFNSRLSYEERFNFDCDCFELSVNVGNMFEGIRANFIDKDKRPHWKIKTFQELTKLYNS